jgi:hypothetical protein
VPVAPRVTASFCVRRVGWGWTWTWTWWAAVIVIVFSGSEMGRKRRLHMGTFYQLVAVDFWGNGSQGNLYTAGGTEMEQGSFSAPADFAWR